MKKYLFVITACIYLSACQPSARFAAGNAPTSAAKTDLNNFVKKWMYTPYKYGGMDKAGVDCSGFTSLVYKNIFRVSIPRTAADQFRQGNIVRRGDIRPGDLVFFSGIRGRGIDHVGVFLGSNRFAHASESSGVVVSNLEETYYKSKFSGVRSFLKR